MTKDDSTWLNICYTLFAGLVAYVVFQAEYTVGVQQGWTEKFDEWFQLVSTISALLLGAGTAYWVRSSVERKEYHLSSIGEIRKVIWPSADDTKRMTIVVVIVVSIFSLILAAFDIAWSKILQSILP